MNPKLPDGTLRAQVEARLLDLSLGGALFLIAATLEVGAVHAFALDLDGRTVWVQAEVRHCRPSPDRSGHQVGVQFVGIDPQDETLLRAYLESGR